MADVRDYANPLPQIQQLLGASPLRVGDTFEDLKRKMIPFATTSSESNTRIEEVVLKGVSTSAGGNVGRDGSIFLTPNTKVKLEEVIEIVCEDEDQGGKRGERNEERGGSGDEEGDDRSCRSDDRSCRSEAASVMAKQYVSDLLAGAVSSRGPMLVD